MSSLAGAAAALGRGADPARRRPERGPDPAGRAHPGLHARPASRWPSFAAHGATMAVFLSAARPDELAAELLAPGSGYRTGDARGHRDPGHLA